MMIAAHAGIVICVAAVGNCWFRGISGSFFARDESGEEEVK